MKNRSKSFGFLLLALPGDKAGDGVFSQMTVSELDDPTGRTLKILR
jgi:hypothetical protein